MSTKWSALIAGWERWPYLAHSQFDLILTDYFMPGLKGDQFAALVKQRWPTLPIILMSGSVCHVMVENGPNDGVDCLLNKPFTVVQLQKAIAWVMARYADEPSEGKLFSGSQGMPWPTLDTDTGSGERRRAQ